MPFCSPLDGTWQMLRAEFDGEQAPDLVARRTTIQFSGGVYRVRFGVETADEGTYEITQTDSIKTLLLFGTAGTNHGKTIPCLFQQVGDRLRVCYGIDGIQPLDFTTKSGQNRYLATYRRIDR